VPLDRHTPRPRPTDLTDLMQNDDFMPCYNPRRTRRHPRESVMRIHRVLLFMAALLFSICAVARAEESPEWATLLPYPSGNHYHSPSVIAAGSDRFGATTFLIKLADWYGDTLFTMDGPVRLADGIGLIKLSSEGQLEWARSVMQAPAQTWYDFTPKGLVVETDGRIHVFCLGTFVDATGDTIGREWDRFPWLPILHALEFSADGTPLEHKTLVWGPSPFVAGNDDLLWIVRRANNGGFLVGGNFIHDDSQHFRASFGHEGAHQDTLFASGDTLQAYVARFDASCKLVEATLIATPHPLILRDFCDLDQGDFGMLGWSLKARPPYAEHFTVIQRYTKTGQLKWDYPLGDSILAIPDEYNPTSSGWVGIGGSKDGTLLGFTRLSAPALTPDGALGANTSGPVNYLVGINPTGRRCYLREGVKFLGFLDFSWFLDLQASWTPVGDGIAYLTDDLYSSRLDWVSARDTASRSRALPDYPCNPYDYNVRDGLVSSGTDAVVAYGGGCVCDAVLGDPLRGGACPGRIVERRLLTATPEDSAEVALTVVEQGGEAPTTARPPAAERAGKATLARTVELWGCGAGGPGIVRGPRVTLGADNVARFDAVALRQALDSFGRVQQAYVFDEQDRLIAKVGFQYTSAMFEDQRRKEGLISIHDEIGSYGIATATSPELPRWKFPRYCRYDMDKPYDVANAEPVDPAFLRQATLLLPPADERGNRIFSEVASAQMPVVFVHGVNGFDGDYWGTEDQAGLAADGSERPLEQLPYPMQVRRATAGAPDPGQRMQCWEFYYPPDQPLQWSGYLLAHDLNLIQSRYPGKPLNIVAHSMGGLVTRATMEGLGWAWSIDPDPVLVNRSFEDVARVVLLGTPTNGSYGANRAYYGVFLPSGLYTAAGFDPSAPAVRDLAVGSPFQLELNRPGIVPFGTTPGLVVAGTSPKGLVPIYPFSDDPVAIESSEHADGIVAISSASLLDRGVPLVLLPGFSHKHLRSPHNEKAPLKADEATAIPKIVVDFLTTRTVSDQVLGVADARLIGAGQAPSPGEAVWSTDHGVIRLDVGLPVVRFRTPGGGDWTPIERGVDVGTRFNLSSMQLPEGNRLLLAFERFADRRGNLRNGAYLYRAENCFEQIPGPFRVPRSGAFVGYERGLGVARNPFDLRLPATGLILSYGLGWQMPYAFTQGGVDLPVTLSIPRLSGAPLYLSTSSHLRARWCQTLYSDLAFDEGVYDVLDGNDLAPRTRNPDLRSRTACNAATRQSIAVDRRVERLVFTLEHTATNDVIVLQTPTGELLRSDQLLPAGVSVKQALADSVLFLRVDTPTTGAWSAWSEPTQDPERNDLTCWRTVSDPMLVETSDPDNATGRIALLAHVTDADSLQGANVMATIALAEGGTLDLPLRDDGYAPDAVAGDGVYCAALPEGELQSVSVSLTATRNGEVMTRGAASAFPAAPTSPTGSELTLARPSPCPWNPAAGSMRVRFATLGSDPVQVMAFDITGRKVLDRQLAPATLNTASVTLEWNGLADSGPRVAPGLYWIQATQGQRRLGTARVVVVGGS
jgi:hypothetical protein